MEIRRLTAQETADIVNLGLSMMREKQDIHKAMYSGDGLGFPTRAEIQKSVAAKTPTADTNEVFAEFFTNLFSQDQYQQPQTEVSKSASEMVETFVSKMEQMQRQTEELREATRILKSRMELISKSVPPPTVRDEYIGPHEHSAATSKYDDANSVFNSWGNLPVAISL